MIFVDYFKKEKMYKKSLVFMNTVNNIKMHIEI